MSDGLDHKSLGHALVIALGSKPKDGGEYSKGDGGDEESTGATPEDLRKASDAAFDALKADDKDAWAEALHSYVKLCDLVDEA